MKVIGFRDFFSGGGGVYDVIVSDRLASENFSNPGNNQVSDMAVFFDNSCIRQKVFQQEVVH